MGIKHKYLARIFISLITIRLVLFIFAPFPAQAQETPVISITAPTLSPWTLSPEGAQPKVENGQLTVTTTDATNHHWRVTASDLDANTAGHMTLYTGGAYQTGTKLSTAMQVQGANGTATLPTAGTVVSGLGNVTNQNSTIDFKQTVQWSDPVSANYRIIVTFTAEFTD